MSIIFMCSGIILVNNLDTLLGEYNISRKELAKQLNINQSTIAAWKARNIIPPVETLYKISSLFEVSIEWLISEPKNSSYNDYHRTLIMRQAIRNRIYECVANKKGVEDADNELMHISFFTNMPNLTYRLLSNWAKVRIDFSEYVLQDIAFTLGLELDYLINGTDSDETKTDETPLQKNDQYILETARKNLNDLFCLDNLTGERRKLAKDMLNQLMKLEHLEYVEKKKSEKKE